MEKKISKKEVRTMIGKQVYAIKKDGTLHSGKLVRIQGNTLMLAPKKGKSVQTKAIIPLVLFDLLAIGTAPYAYGGYPYGFGGYPPYGPYGFGYPGFW